MAKFKTIQPQRKPKKEEGNPKALKITAIAAGALLILLIALIIFVNN